MEKEQAIGTNLDYFLKVVITETNISQINNTSSVTVKFYGHTNRNDNICSYNNNGTNSISITIDGSTQTLSNQNIDTRQWNDSSNGKLLYEFTKENIVHNDNGEKTVTVTASINYKGGGSSLTAGIYSVGNVSFVLTTIARTSSFGTISNTNITSTSNSLSIKINKQNNSFYDKVTVAYKTWSTDLLFGNSSTKTLSWTTLLNNITDTSSAQVTLTLKTYQNNDYTGQIGSAVNKTITITIDTSKTGLKPVFNWTSAITVNTRGCQGYLVAGKSTATASWTVTKAAGNPTTTVKFTGVRCTITSATATSTATTGNVITKVLPSNTNTSGSPTTITFKAVITDSRGASVTVDNLATANVYPYITPKVTLIAYRTSSTSTSSPTEDPTGSRVYINCIVDQQGATVTVNGVNKNTYSINVSRASSGGISTSTNIPYNGTLNENTILTVTASVADTVMSTGTGSETSITITKVVSSALVPFSLYSNDTGTQVGVGVGTAASANKFSINLPIEYGANARIGQMVVSTNTVSTLDNATYTNICSLSLTKGIWLVTANFHMPVASSETGRVVACISQTSKQLYQGAYTAYTNNIIDGSKQAGYATNLARIIQLNSTTTLYLVVTQNSGSSKTLNTDYSIMRAICLA